MTDKITLEDIKKLDDEIKENALPALIYYLKVKHNFDVNEFLTYMRMYNKEGKVRVLALAKMIKDNESTNPLNKSGANGLYKRRHEFEPHLADLSKHKFDEIIKKLLNEKRIKEFTPKRILGTPEGLLSEQYGESGVKVLKDALIKAISEAEQKGQPFKKNAGVASLWERKYSCLPKSLKNLPKVYINQLIEDCLSEGQIIICAHGNEKSPTWLCNPNGPLRTSPEDYEFKKGAAE